MKIQPLSLSFLKAWRRRKTTSFLISRTVATAWLWAYFGLPPLNTCLYMDKEDVVYILIHNGILLNTSQYHEKEWNNAIWSNMDGLEDYHTKWSKSGRERQTPYDITYMWNLKENTKELIYKTVLCVLNPFSGVQLCVTLWTLPRQDPLSVGFSRQE